MSLDGITFYKTGRELEEKRAKPRSLIQTAPGILKSSSGETRLAESLRTPDTMTFEVASCSR